MPVTNPSRRFYGNDIMAGGTPRVVNIALGAWLFLSTFLWPHTNAQATNSWLCGALIIVLSAVSNRYANARYGTAAVAVWLFISVWALATRTPATFWNNLLVSIAVFFVSLMGVMPRRTVPGGPAQVVR
jgi:hypothetical protein